MLWEMCVIEPVLKRPEIFQVFREIPSKYQSVVLNQALNT